MVANQFSSDHDGVQTRAGGCAGGLRPAMPPHGLTLKVRKGRWPEMEPYAPHLGRICVTNGFKIAPYTVRMAILAGSMEWDHPDPFDRMIGVTAFEMGMALVSSDEAFGMLDEIPGWRSRIWVHSFA